jgi:hypothetical protein
MLEGVQREGGRNEEERTWTENLWKWKWKLTDVNKPQELIDGLNSTDFVQKQQAR